ncbi:MAG TPA: nuclear transport factor 2 family protein [Azospirillum sp.]|nr:nuclear transport factor 2 family protein [Azospirillum sp.]
MATFDFDALKQAVEHSDADTLVRLYADDAEMVVIDRDRPPSAPMTLAGKDAIAAFWRDVCGRAMTHHIEREVVGPDRVSYVEECAYPDGCHVTAAMTLDLRDGRIARHLTVQAWDETGASSH